MYRIISSLVLALLVGCSQVSTQPPISVNADGVQILDGPAIATQLNTLYGRKFPNCNKSDSQPAFLCSGVTLRVTVKDPNNQYKVWDPSPTSVKSGGVSFSYLRQDANFGRLAWGNGNGYILYPIFEAPKDKEDLDYLCSYPEDAWTWHRSETAVCVAHPSYPTQSQLCQDAGVTTAEQWLAVWNTAGGNPNLRQCGFDVRDERNYLAGPAFYQSVRSKELRGAAGFGSHNEILIKTWASRHPNTFPIMAFFFIAGGSNAGLADARYNQQDFYNSTNPKIIVPIIRLTPATSATGAATFTYVAADQQVTQ
ncbi:halovibrin HvnC [Pseudomonas sp. 91RF]|jgi:hypothetical protein|uniref:halovibrin HvnC n=1 Tax=Pseudomonas sp. 91RF TaxID=2292261 RepID=UPI000E674988|nr:halovibrin HvnC [Pseudomonas sp. 91RF]RIJ13466.1 halovibrin HvnC [Pseudomonas sp. 91RF]